MKKCSRCEETKTLDQYGKDANRKGGLNCWCKDCCNRYSRERPKSPDEKAKRIAHARVYLKTPQGKRVDSGKQLRKNYGMSVEDWARMFEAQGGRCAVCGKEMDPNAPSRKGPAVDHCHKTGKVRGLLHRKCNSLLGMVDDDIETLLSAALYLERHR